MTTMQFNNQTVELKPQENGPFLHLAGNMIPALSAGEPFAKICCHICCTHATTIIFSTVIMRLIMMIHGAWLICWLAV